MLQPGIGAHVTAKLDVQQPQILPTPVQTLTVIDSAYCEAPRPSGGVPEIQRQFLLTATADQVLKKLIGTYSDATGIDLKNSELLRAIFVACDHAMPELIREAQQIGPLRRPKNDRGREAEREELERRIAKAFVAGLRASASLS